MIHHESRGDDQRIGIWKYQYIIGYKTEKYKKLSYCQVRHRPNIYQTAYAELFDRIGEKIRPKKTDRLHPDFS